MPSLRMRRRGLAGGGLGRRGTRRVAVGVAGVDGHRRVLHGRGRAFERERHVGELVLDRLERADRHVELLAFLRVGERHVEDAARGADHLGRERDVRAVAPRARASSGSTRLRAVETASVSSSKTRREKSTVATKRSGRDGGGVDDGDASGRRPTIAMRSTRSASSTNGFIGSSTATRPCPVATCRRPRR